MAWSVVGGPHVPLGLCPRVTANSATSHSQNLFRSAGSHSGLCGDEEIWRGVGTGARTSAGLSLGLRETGRFLVWVTEGTAGHLLSKTGRLRGQAFGEKSSKLTSHNVTGIGLQMATDVRPCPSSRFLC